jgi:hypothetical protein
MNESKTPNPNHNQPKLKQINVRVSEAELLLLQQYSTECKLSISEYLRRCSLKRNLPRPPTHLLEDVFALINARARQVVWQVKSLKLQFLILLLAKFCCY